jgi:uncharacterized protein (DUF924 family)
MRSSPSHEGDGPLTDSHATADDVLRFWFEEITPDDWFTATPELDAECGRRFARLHLSLSRQMDPRWRQSPEARLAAIILFDQIPRNIYRGSPLAFATDGLARREARLALDVAADQAVGREPRLFFYLPFEHAESLEDQDLSVALFSALGDPKLLDFAERHARIVRRFGRFPHRNAILGRETTAEEAAFLQEPGSSF